MPHSLTQPISLGRLFSFLWQTIGKYSKLILLSIVASVGLSYIAPLAFKQLIDVAVPVSDFNLVIAVAAALFFLNVTEGLLVFVRSQSVLVARSLMTRSAQESLWWRVIHLPCPFFRNRPSGELVHQSMMISTIGNGIGTNIVQAGTAGLVAISSGLLATWLSPKLMLFAVPLAIVEALVLSVLIARIRKRTLRLETYRAKVTGQVTNQLNGIIKIQSTGSETHSARQTSALNEIAIREDERIQLLEDIRGILSIALPAASTLVIFMVGFAAVTQGDSSLRFRYVYRIHRGLPHLRIRHLRSLESGGRTGRCSRATSISRAVFECSSCESPKPNGARSTKG